MTGNDTFEVRTPAKINLGLEILGKREDGYHELRTVFATAGLYDTLRFTVASGSASTRITGTPGISQDDNLIQKAITAFEGASGIACAYDIEVTKGIPSPGGLGGASSDAAATLRALNTIHGTPLTNEALHILACGLGADVPFFLVSPVAEASGIGTDLRPLPPFQAHVVLAVPRLRMDSKTASLYRALIPSDFTDGTRSALVANAIREGNLPSAEVLVNAFTRAAHDAMPELQQLAVAIRDAGAPTVAMSGSGPAHYALFASAYEADAFAREMRHVPLPANTMITAVPIGVESPATRIIEL